MQGDLLSIQPGELVFPFELKKQVSCSLRLINLTSEYVAFKIKTTSPKKYCVRPNTGVVPPQSSTELEVVMQAHREVPTDMTCKDKFLVQSVVISQGTSANDVTQDLFIKEKGKDIRETKLKVIYTPPKQSPSPNPDSNGEPIASKSKSDQGPTQQSKETESRPSKLEFNDAKEKFVSFKKPDPNSSGDQTVALPVKRGWSFLHLLFVGLLAFIFGYLCGHSPVSPTAS